MYSEGRQAWNQYMRTFIIRSRKGTARWEKVRSQIGTGGHLEIVAHAVINAFFVSNDFRHDVEVYIVLDSSEDFPRTIKLSASDGLSIAGFHEAAVIELIEKILKNSKGLQKNETRLLEAGVQISGFGFEKLLENLLETRTLYLLDPKGSDIRVTALSQDPVFVLSDHLAMPKNNVKSLTRRGVNSISLGKKILFASQCVTLIHYEMDRASL